MIRPNNGEILLALLSVEEAEKLPLEYLRQRFPKRAEKASGFRFREDGLRSLAAGALLAAAGIREENLGYGEKGKPFCRESGICFNLSHSGAFAVLALSGDEVGVDLEKEDPARLNLAERLMTGDEREWMSEDPLSRFFALWTMKESLGKLTGEGLTRAVRERSVMPILRGNAIDLGGKPAFGRILPFAGYGLAVAAFGELPEVRVRTLTAAEILREG